MKGYKGFKVSQEGKLQCRLTDFEEGKAYKVAGEAIACVNGYHFCKNLRKVLTESNYKLTEGHYYAQIEAKGDFDTEGFKKCATQITIKKLLSMNEVMAELGGRKLKPVEESDFLLKTIPLLMAFLSV